MGRHSAPRRHGPVVLAGAVSLVGSAGGALSVALSPVSSSSPEPDVTTPGTGGTPSPRPTPSRR
ncbi:MAG TPA: hypothetical protein VLQ78_00265 [Ornithinibacter sp.]|nr:hypothetical protein [Ornithinibacter sp.]